LGVVQAVNDVVIVPVAVFAGRKHTHLLLAQVQHAAKQLAHAHRPGEGHHAHAEFAFDLVHQVQWLLHFAVHLVHEGQDGCVSRAADLQQATCLRLHTVGRVDDHQRRVHGGQHTVGVFAEVLVARACPAG
jgi:hypothetical protein